MKMSFQGMTAHWIEVKEGKWKMKAAVIGFKGISGAHSGENLSRYSVGLLDCVGIMDKNGLKACRMSLCPFWKLFILTDAVTALCGNVGQHQ